MFEVSSAGPFIFIFFFKVIVNQVLQEGTLDLKRHIKRLGIFFFNQDLEYLLVSE